MANVKFSQFTPASSSTDVDYLVGYKGTDNVKIQQSSLLVPSSFMMTGVFSNMFGGDPGGTGKDILEWSPTTPVSTHSSVLNILQDCRITAAGLKWISSTVCPVIGPTDSWEVYIYKMNNPLTDSTTIDANFTLVGTTGIIINASDSGTTPGKFTYGLNIVLSKGDIIRVAGIETGVIATTTEECQLSLLFETIV